MVEVAPIEEILIHIDPDLDYGPDWMPAPSPPIELPVLGARGDWSDIFDWVKEHAILPQGRPIDSPWTSPDEVQQMVDASMGETIKALSGFMNRTAALVVQAASILEDATTNLEAKETYDFRTLSQQLDRIQNVQDFLVSQAIPAIFAQFDAERATMVHVVAQQSTADRQWATDHILAPLIESLGSLETRTRQVIDLKAEESHQISAQQVAGLAAQLAPAIATAAASAAAAATWIDDCGAPMCETVGPKTDLGKLLKALKIGATLALLAELANLDEHGVENLLRGLQHLASGVIGTFDDLFIGGGGTLGETITGAGG